MLGYWKVTFKHRPRMVWVYFVFVARHAETDLFSHLRTQPAAPRSTEVHWYRWPFSCQYNYDPQQKAWLGQIEYGSGPDSDLWNLLSSEGIQIVDATLEEYLARETTGIADVPQEACSVEFVLLRRMRE
jgi:hypothetical protein